MFIPGAEPFLRVVAGRSFGSPGSETWTVPGDRVACLTHASSSCSIAGPSANNVVTAQGPVWLAPGTRIEFQGMISGFLVRSVDMVSRADFDEQARLIQEKAAAMQAAVKAAALDALKGAALELFTGAAASALREDPEALWRAIEPRVQAAISAHLGSSGGGG